MWQRKRRQNGKARLDDSMSNLFGQCLKGKKAGKRWKDLISYTFQDLINHLKNQFDDKMTWDNYGKYWEIDHIKPKSLFHYESPEDPEFKKCWALENLQPMEKIMNRIKYNKYDNASS